MPTNDLTQLLSMLNGGQLLSGPKKPLRAGFDPAVLGDESIDPSVRADQGNMAMQGELKERLFNTTRTQNPGRNSGLEQSPNATNPNEVDALKQLLGGYEDERNDPKTMLNQQAGEYANQRKLLAGAQNEGFQGGNGQSPLQARNIYHRNLEQEKARQPIQLQTMREGGENFRQGRQIDATQRMIETQMGPAQQEADTRQSYNDALISGQIETPEGFRGMNRYGPQFTPQPSTTPATRQQQARALTEARDFMGRIDGNYNPIQTFGGNSPNQAGYDQVVMNEIAQSGLDNESQNTIHMIIRDPVDRKLTISQLMQKYDNDPTDPDTQVAIALLRKIGFLP